MICISSQELNFCIFLHLFFLLSFTEVSPLDRSIYSPGECGGAWTLIKIVHMWKSDLKAGCFQHWLKGVSRTNTDVISILLKLPQALFGQFRIYNNLWGPLSHLKIYYPVNPQPKKQFVITHLQRAGRCILSSRREGRSLKRAHCQLRQSVLVWTHSVQEEHIRQCFEEQHHMTRCQIYLTANSFLWSGTEYMKRISLLQCVWQRSLVFSIVKHVPDDHPCVHPDSEQN